MSILKTAALVWWPPARKKALARDEKYAQARMLGCSISDFNDYVAITQMKDPQLDEFAAMDAVLGQLRQKGPMW